MKKIGNTGTIIALILYNIYLLGKSELIFNSPYPGANTLVIFIIVTSITINVFIIATIMFGLVRIKDKNFKYGTSIIITTIYCFISSIFNLNGMPYIITFFATLIGANLYAYIFYRFSTTTHFLIFLVLLINSLLIFIPRILDQGIYWIQ